MTTLSPGWHHQGLHMFDVGDVAQGDGDEITDRVAKPMGNLLQAAAGFCQTGTCKVQDTNPTNNAEWILHRLEKTKLTTV